MIIVNVNSLNNNSIELIIKGHSEYDKFGKDIVCSAVSCSSIGALNALENPKGFKIVVEDGYLELRNICDITKHDQIVIETLIIQLKSIEESYPKYIKVVEKGN